MRNYIKYFNQVCAERNLINKFSRTVLRKNTQINKVAMSFLKEKSSNSFKATLICLLAVEAISKQKSVALLSKKSNTSIKLRKNFPIGSKTIIKKKVRTLFILKFLSLLHLKDERKKVAFKQNNKNSATYKNSDNYILTELENNFRFFQKLQFLNVSCSFRTYDRKEMPFIWALSKLT